MFMGWKIPYCQDVSSLLNYTFNVIPVKVPGHFFLCMLTNWFKDVYDSSKT